MRWRVRLTALAAAGGFLAVALAIRLLVSTGGVLDGSGVLAQHSGTALYASMIYAGVFLLAPATRPMVAGAVAIASCWTVELLQLTGIPAELSERSLLARLALGVAFDPVDLIWYPVGVLPVVALHHVLAGKRVATAARA
ncbi:DUF2809 domain-containing protein [Actinoplanes sp. NBC_00393]|uniref:ribosomal maturation YjgA family protein n=1 Tax=Actinoplanes sp. NBC_00393 TaxID=2975953 RepID=UPI002E203DE6